MAPYIGILIFVILIVLDILGHRKLKVGRKSIDWFFLCLFAATAAFCVFSAVRARLPGQTTESPGSYLAYRYLIDGDVESARAVLLQAGNIPDGTESVLTMLADALDNDYRSLYFSTEQFLADPSKAPAQEEIVKELNEYAVAGLEGGKTGRKDIQSLAEESFGLSEIKETVELREYYDLDSRIRSGNAAEADPDKIYILPASFPEEDSVKKLVISYYIQTGDFESAQETAKELIDEEDSVSNRIIYTDVMAEAASRFSRDAVEETEDSEIDSLISKSDQAEAKADAAEYLSEQYVKQKESAEEYLEEIPKVSYQRIVNYINVKKPVFGDRTGLYELQLIKMKYLSGDTSSAFESVKELLEKADELDDSSSLKEVLITLKEDMEQYYLAQDDPLREKIAEDCELLLRSQCEGVDMIGEDNINVHSARLIAAGILYDRAMFEITKVDASAFPKVTVRVNTNFQKGNIFGGSGEFYRDDFKISENGEEYTDFTMSADMGAGDRCLVVAADLSTGDSAVLPSLFDALKTAGSSAAARKHALIDGNANTVCGFSDSPDFYLTTARGLTTEGTASSLEMIRASAALFEEEKTEDPVILLISDDLDLTQDQNQEIRSILSEQAITLYVINMSGKNGDAAEAAADAGGGLYFGVSLREELLQAVNMVKDLLNNGYIFSYKTSDDITGAHTVTVKLAEPEAEDSAGYLQEVNG